MALNRDRGHSSISSFERAMWLLTAVLAVLVFSSQARGQTPIRDLVIEDQAVPVRLMGYGLVVGLDNTGDNGYGGRSSQQTVQSVVIHSFLHDALPIYRKSVV